jgi:hypothetical protein
MGITQIILQLLVLAPQAVAEITALYQKVQPGLTAEDQATLDTAIAALSAKIDADVAQLDADAAAHGG